MEGRTSILNAVRAFLDSALAVLSLKSELVRPLNGIRYKPAAGGFPAKAGAGGDGGHAGAEIGARAITDGSATSKYTAMPSSRGGSSDSSFKSTIGAEGKIWLALFLSASIRSGRLGGRNGTPLTPSLSSGTTTDAVLASLFVWAP
jgi:hypothetical protein